MHSNFLFWRAASLVHLTGQHQKINPLSLSRVCVLHLWKRISIFILSVCALLGTPWMPISHALMITFRRERASYHARADHLKQYYIKCHNGPLQRGDETCRAHGICYFQHLHSPHTALSQTDRWIIWALKFNSTGNWEWESCLFNTKIYNTIKVGNVSLVNDSIIFNIINTRKNTLYGGLNLAWWAILNVCGASLCFLGRHSTEVIHLICSVRYIMHDEKFWIESMGGRGSADFLFPLKLVDATNVPSTLKKFVTNKFAYKCSPP